MPMMPAMISGLLPPNHGAEMNSMGGTSVGLTTSSPSTTGGTDSRSPSPEAAKKPTRPSSSYPMDPLPFNEGDRNYNTDSNETYEEFRKRMLESLSVRTKHRIQK